MRKNKISISVLLLVCLLCLSGCITFAPHASTTPTTQSTPPPSEPDTPHPILDRYLSTEYEYDALFINETILQTGHSASYLLLMNKLYTLGENYVPSSLTRLNCPTDGGETHQLETRAALALEEMFREMEADGITDVFVTSAYRSYAYQQALFRLYVQREQEGFSQDAYNCLGTVYIQTAYLDKGLTGLSEEDARTVVQSYSAQAGTSEHQTGLCVDFITSDMSGLTVNFENTEAFAWLSENAYKFGYILRYPKDKEYVTGYTYEPWHYRYVGREAATNIYFANLTLEEYLQIVNAS